MDLKSSDIAECIRRIEDLLAEVIAVQRPHVLSVCGACPDPCCRRVQHLFDEKDLLFLQLSGRRRGRVRRSVRKLGCIYLTPGGCRLEPGERPFACHRYLCDALRREMARLDPEGYAGFQGRLDRLDRLRSRLCCCYLDAEVASGRSGI